MALMDQVVERLERSFAPYDELLESVGMTPGMRSYSIFSSMRLRTRASSFDTSMGCASTYPTGGGRGTLCREARC